MNMALQHEITSTTYEDVSALIRSIVDKFLRRYQPGKSYLWEREELLQEARLVWIKKFQEGKYKQNRAAFTTWTHLIVWGHLLERMRKEIYRNNRFGRVYLDDINTVCIKPVVYDTEILFEQLSEDGRTVAKLALEQPYEIIFNARLLGDTENLAAAIWDHLRGIGWEAARIRCVWDEIRKVI